MIDEQNKKIGEEIQHHLKLQGMSDVEKLQARDNLLKEIEEYKANNVEKEAQI